MSLSPFRKRRMKQTESACEWVILPFSFLKKSIQIKGNLIWVDWPKNKNSGPCNVLSIGFIMSSTLKKNRISKFVHLLYKMTLWPVCFRICWLFRRLGVNQQVEVSKLQCSHMGESLQSSCYIWETRNAFITSVTLVFKPVKWNHSRLKLRRALFLARARLMAESVSVLFYFQGSVTWAFWKCRQRL